jgi:transposase
MGRAVAQLKAFFAHPTPLSMDRAHEGDKTREYIEKCGLKPGVPPKSSRPKPWGYDKMIHNRRNEIEKLFRRINAFRRVFSRFEKGGVMFTAFGHVALIMERIKSC